MPPRNAVWATIEVEVIDLALHPTDTSDDRPDVPPPPKLKLALQLLYVTK